MTRPKFNRICLFDDCPTWTVTIFCKPHYMSLPKHMRWALWSDDLKKGEAINAALDWMRDKRDNMLIVREEGP